PGTLPGSAREAVAFRRTVPGAVTHTGASATEARLREALSDGEVVHVASHGVMNLRNPMFSRIELSGSAGGPADDGRLEVHELLDLRIQAPFVFLSGCETGVGAAWSTQFARGEDYATLAQAFLYAGARNVMATLWRIEDKGAAAFAERFYTHLAVLPPPEALAAAQQDLLQTPGYAAPHYWAPYQISGSGDRLLSHTGRSLSVELK
ncbi:MAG: CHAT domain-containing protein, partial [Gemmatimonadales bacterium]